MPASPKLLIIFRHYREDLYFHKSRDPNKKRPKYFSNAICLLSILNAIEASTNAESISLLIWYDGSDIDFNTDPIFPIIKQFSSRINLKFYKKDYKEIGSNASEVLSFPEILKYLSIEDEHKYYYLVENDYLHRATAINALFELFSSHPLIDYLNLADHRDYYHLAIHTQHHTKFIYTENFIAKSCVTTTGTFAGRAETFKADLPEIFGRADFEFFTRLTGIRGRQLWTVVPSQATHCMENLMAPGVDWITEAEKLLNQALKSS
jgi:hypothetical protein